MNAIEIKKIENTDETIDREYSKKRYDNIDLIKTIAMFMVIMLHTLPWHTNFLRDENIKTYLMFLLRIICEGVPIYILVNGFLIMNKKFDMKKHMKKIFTIFSILVIWSFIYVIFIKWIDGEIINLKDVIIEMISVKIGNQYTGTLWFLQNLIMLYLMFPILKVVHDNNKKIYNYFFIAVTVFTVGEDLIEKFIIIIDNVLNLNLYIYIMPFIQKYNFVNNGTFIFYFMLGGYLFEYKDIFSKNKNRILAIIIAILSCLASFMLGIFISKVTNVRVSDSFNYSSVFMAIMIIGLYAVTYKYTNKQHFYNKIIANIGRKYTWNISCASYYNSNWI